jgi:hypothetical protein
MVALVTGRRTSCPNVSAENAIRTSVVLSYSVLLTPIVDHPNRGGNCVTADKVNQVVTVNIRMCLHEPVK